MDNRGSKSMADFFNLTRDKSIIVKEQRVDDSWQVGNPSCLRYTLIDFDKNRVANVLSNKQLQSKRFYTTAITKLSPSLPTSSESCVIDP